MPLVPGGRHTAIEALEKRAQRVAKRPEATNLSVAELQSQLDDLKRQRSMAARQATRIEAKAAAARLWEDEQRTARAFAAIPALAGLDVDADVLLALLSDPAAADIVRRGLAHPDYADAPLGAVLGTIAASATYRAQLAAAGARLRDERLDAMLAAVIAEGDAQLANARILDALDDELSRHGNIFSDLSPKQRL